MTARWLIERDGVLELDRTFSDEWRAVVAGAMTGGNVRAVEVRILVPGEVDAETVERCARLVDAEGDTWSNSRDLDVALQEAAVDKKCEQIAAALRSLTGGRT